MAKNSKQPIFTASLVDQVYEYLLDKIITNDLSYGDNLNIKDLSETLGISTMPVREAIKRLEYERVVEVKPRSSCQIRVPGKEEIVSIYELREALELFAIKKFLHTFNIDRLEPLDAIIEKMKSIDSIKTPKNRTQEAMNLDREFHKELCALGDNEYLCLYHRQLSLHLNMAAIHAKSYQQLRDRWTQSHIEIIEHLRARSQEALGSLEKHFDNVWAVL